MPTEPDAAMAVVTSLLEISEHSKDIMIHAKHSANGGVEQFISKDIGKLFKIVWTYKKAFERLQVDNKEEFEKAVSNHFRKEKVRELFDEFLESEQVWDEFLLDIDTQIVVSNNKPLVEGDLFPISMSVVNARTGFPATVGSFIEKKSLILVLLRHFA